MDKYRSQISNLKIEITLLLIVTINLAACGGSGKLPAPSSAEYREAVTAFYVGLGALQATDDIRAKQRLTRFSELAPGEPAGWANLGILALRQQEFDAAYYNFEKARAIVPANSRLEVMLGLVEAKRGRFAEAIAHLRRAVDLDPKNIKALSALALEIERQGGEDSEAQNLIEKILQVQPGNLAALLELTRMAAKRGDAETARRSVALIGQKSGNWPPEIERQFESLQSAVNGPNVRAAATRVAFLRNVLVRLPEYRQSLAAIRYPTEETGEPFERFLKLTSPPLEIAAPDLQLTFESQSIRELPAGKWNMISALALDGDGKSNLVIADDEAVQIVGGAKLQVAGARFILPIDFNYDFKTDLVIQGRDRLWFFQQESPSRFIDVTAKTGLPKQAITAGYSFAKTLDVDLDGDLDIWLSSISPTAQTLPIVLRNNGDGTFKAIEPFKFAYDREEGLIPGRDSRKQDLRGAWQENIAVADLDGDGDPEVAMVSKANCFPCGLQMRVFINERLGRYREVKVPFSYGTIVDVATADINNDGLVDLVVLGSNGKIYRVVYQEGDRIWEFVELTELKEFDEKSRFLASKQRLRIADFDNNGALDLLVESPSMEKKYPLLQVFLNDGRGHFNFLETPPGAGGISIADLTGDGRLDLIGLQAESEADSNRKPVILANKGTKNYHWQIIRPRAASATGDQRINPFGIGGEIELRAGLLFQKQIIDSPVVHFGLGEQTQTDVARFIWPNGSVQGEFELKADQAVLAEQRLKGSCPWLFAWNGKSMEFVKDCAPWSPALGLKINAQVTAGISQTEEWMKIRGDQLAPRDGYYDLRITAELWETYYIDHYSLVVVDHPAETEIFTDERCAHPPPALKIYATARPRPFARARDEQGHDVSGIVSALDEKYLDTFGRGRYQGVTRDHYVELELPEEAPRSGQLWLIAHGFVHPTDTTVNIAMSQPDSYVSPKGLSLEAPAAGGGWRVVNPNLGFPAGKKKTALIDLTGVMSQPSPRRFRLRTNLEIYWDQLEWAAGSPETQIETQRLNAETAELRFRGYSVVEKADDSSPELPDYNRLEFTGQRWRDLIGYYTRYGDVRELLAKVDDRIVLVNAGDELRLRFKARPDPPAGWSRDYLLIGNGWIKDGDYNSTFSKTVLPLPEAKMREYTKAPGRLEDDPVYQRHARDWQEFHTRYVTPERFRNALRKIDN